LSLELMPAESKRREKEKKYTDIAQAAGTQLTGQLPIPKSA
jgi:hypothetical protein